MDWKQQWKSIACGSPVVMAVVLAATLWPIALPVIVGVVVLLVVAVQKPDLVAPGLLVAAVPFMRPNLFGEHVALVGTGLCLAAAFVALIADRATPRLPGALLWVPAGLVTASLWLIFQTNFFRVLSITTMLQGIVTTGLTVLAAALVLVDARRRVLFARGFVWLVLIACSSYVVTLIAWLVMGIGSLKLGTLVLSTEVNSAGLYFPFTPTSGTVNVNATTFQRFTGFGREPGWMSMYAGTAFLLWPKVGKPRLLGRIIILVGLLGAFSTAGFGVFVVVLALSWLSRKSKTKDAAIGCMGLAIKVALVAVAAYVAVVAPVFGLSSKGEMNSVSLDERSNAMKRGVDAVSDSPLGGVHGVQEAINLVAALAPNGVPYVLIISSAVLLPLLARKYRPVFAPVMLVFLTLLLSQPPGDSTFAYILVVLAYSLALKADEVDQHDGEPQLSFTNLAPPR